MNIRNSDWDSLYPFYLIHSDLLIDITDAFDLSPLYSTNSIPTKYSDNKNNLNSINLIFLTPNMLKFDNHTILPELHYSFEHSSNS